MYIGNDSSDTLTLTHESCLIKSLTSVRPRLTLQSVREVSEKCQRSVRSTVSEVSVCKVVRSRHESVREKYSN